MKTESHSKEQTYQARDLKITEQQNRDNMARKFERPGMKLSRRQHRNEPTQDKSLHSSRGAQGENNQWQG